MQLVLSLPSAFLFLVAGAIPTLGGWGQSEASPPTDALNDNVNVGVTPIAAAYAAGGPSPRASANVIAMMVLAQHEEGIFSAVPI